MTASKLGYIAWHTEAERRYRRGQRQKRCADCGRYVFMQWRRDVLRHKSWCLDRPYFLTTR